VSNKLKVGVLALITTLIISFSLLGVLVEAQYTTSQTTDVTLGSDGTFTATQPNVGVSYQIAGTPGAIGTVTADRYNGNPQPTATIPNGVTLTNFIAITFNMNPSDFSQATITVNYADSEVQNINSPYTIYKYVTSSNSYVALPSTVDANSKTITVTLTSVTDPLLAIGGAATTSHSGSSSTTWILIVVSIVLVVVAIVFVVKILRPSGKSKGPSGRSKLPSNYRE
jgi:hypothetical protein